MSLQFLPSRDGATGSIAPPSPTGPGSISLTFDPTAGGERVGLTGGSPTLSSVLRQPDGTVLIGGWFNGVNGVPRNNIARLNDDGGLDPDFRPGLGTDGAISGLALQVDGKLLVVGGFRTVNGQARPLIVRLNADGSVDDTFNCVLEGDANLSLAGVAVQASGKIWIGGQIGARRDQQPHRFGGLASGDVREQAILLGIAGARAARMRGENFSRLVELGSDDRHGKAVGGVEVRTGAGCGEQLRQFGEPASGCVGVSSLAMAVPGVDLGAMIQQDCHGVLSPPSCGHMKRSFTPAPLTGITSIGQALLQEGIAIRAIVAVKEFVQRHFLRDASQGLGLDA